MARHTAKTMQRTDFDFTLPPELIARYPAKTRRASRLLAVSRQAGSWQHHQFTDFLEKLHPEDVLVFNNSKVIAARLYAQKSTGGRVEILLERITSNTAALAQVRGGKNLSPGAVLTLENGVSISIGEPIERLYPLTFSAPLLAVLEQVGQVPLPPYLRRPAEPLDKERYQTVYADPPGSVAAPTAGLHFDAEMLELIAEQAVFITLHVGLGTFEPIRSADVTSHRLHAEHMVVSEAVCARIRAAKARGGRVIAIGTTSVRALETAAADGILTPYEGESRLFIYPGYRFRCVEAMLTNFHLPESSLLLLVAAFMGTALWRKTYEAAIAERYRFYSYGDAMWIADDAF